MQKRSANATDGRTWHRRHAGLAHGSTLDFIDLTVRFLQPLKPPSRWASSADYLACSLNNLGAKSRRAMRQNAHLPGIAPQRLLYYETRGFDISTADDRRELLPTGIHNDEHYLEFYDDGSTDSVSVPSRVRPRYASTALTHVPRGLENDVSGNARPMSEVKRIANLLLSTDEGHVTAMSRGASTGRTRW